MSDLLRVWAPKTAITRTRTAGVSGFWCLRDARTRTTRTRRRRRATARARSGSGDHRMRDGEDREAGQSTDDRAVEADVLQVTSDHELDLLGRLRRIPTFDRI